MRNYNRSQRGARRDAGHNVAGVGELRAVAERLLETGAQYLEQGRQWLHEATSKERAHADQEHAGHHHVDEGGFGSSRAGSREDAGGGGSAWSGSARGGSAYGAYAPDESSFSETGGNPGWRAHSGHDYDDHRTREFDARAEELARNRGRGHHRHGHGHHRHGGGYEEDPFLPGSYGFGGEGRRQAGPSDFSGQGRSGRHAAEDASGRWEQAYRAQGQGSQRGRGPRGYTRSDARILEDVNERLCDDPIVDASDIEVRCEQGCIVLEGRVPTRWMKHRAEDIADAISGVKDVDNRIRVAAEEPAPTGDFDTGGGSRWQSSEGASAPTSRSASSTGSGTGSSSGSGASAPSGSGGANGPGTGAGQGSGTSAGTGSSPGSGSTSGASASSGAASGASTSGASSPPSGTGSTSGAASTSGISPSSGAGSASGGASGTGSQGSGQAGDATRNPPQPH